MAWLAIDTTQDAVDLALRLSDGRVLLSLNPMDRGHGERLMPLIAALMQQAEQTPRDLRAVIVNTGPGAFTGIRTGVAAARGLALGLEVPAIGIDAFRALAACAPAQPGILGVAIGGERNQGWLRSFAHDGATWQPINDGMALAWAGAEDRLLEHDWLLGIRHAQRPSLPNIDAGARMVALLALGTAAGPESNLAIPNYLRAADATPSSQQPPKLLS